MSMPALTPDGHVYVYQTVARRFAPVSLNYSRPCTDTPAKRLGYGRAQPPGLMTPSAIDRRTLKLHPSIYKAQSYKLEPHLPCMLNRLHRTIFTAAPLAGLFSRTPYTPPILSMATSDKVEVATFASGCYWGTEHIFVKHYGQKGILKTAVGFTGGDVSNPSYRLVCTGSTGHAEALRIEFDPEKVGYAELVEFFYRTHNPTTLNRQGNDSGTQYRSAIFTHSTEQEKIAKEVTAEVQAKRFDPIGKRIVTTILPAGEWYPADESHQMYLFKNPNGYQCETHRLHW